MKNKMGTEEEIEYFEYKVEKKLLFSWILTVKKLARGMQNLETAIEIAKMYADSVDDKKAVDKVAILFRAECSGLLKPPISLKKIYISL